MRFITTRGRLTNATLAATVLLTSSVARAQWQIVEDEEKTISCRDFRFATGNTGWITMSSGLARTTDAGETWTEVTVPEGVSPQGGWLNGPTWLVVTYTNVNTGPVQQAPIVQRSTDAGKSWEAVVVDYGSSVGALMPQKVQMVSANVGYLGGFTYEDGDHHLFIFRTDDAGKTWVKLELPNTHTENSVRLDVRSEDEVFFLPYNFAPHHTTDGGKTWSNPTETPLRFMAFDPNSDNALGFTHMASNNGWGAVFASTNGGATLVDNEVATAKGVDTQVGAGFTSNGDAILALTLANAPYARYLRSSDLGATWTEETLPDEWEGAGAGCVASADGLVYVQEKCGGGSCGLRMLRWGEPLEADPEDVVTEPPDEVDAGSVEAEEDAGMSTTTPTTDDEAEDAVTSTQDDESSVDAGESSKPDDEASSDAGAKPSAPKGNDQDADDSNNEADDGDKAKGKKKGGCSVVSHSSTSLSPWWLLAAFGVLARRKTRR